MTPDMGGLSLYEIDQDVRQRMQDHKKASNDALAKDQDLGRLSEELSQKDDFVVDGLSKLTHIINSERHPTAHPAKEDEEPTERGGHRAMPMDRLAYATKDADEKEGFLTTLQTIELLTSARTESHVAEEELMARVGLYHAANGARPALPKDFLTYISAPLVFEGNNQLFGLWKRPSWAVSKPMSFKQYLVRKSEMRRPDA